jgi:hypothetical protein
MADETSILRIAEDERDNAQRAYAEHRRTCTVPVCMDCFSLDGHVIRTRKQVDLLTGPAPAGEESLF